MPWMLRRRHKRTVQPPAGEPYWERKNYCAELESYCDQLETIIDYHVKRLEDMAVTLWDILWSSCAEQMNAFARDLRAEALDRHRPERPPYYRPRE